MTGEKPEEFLDPSFFVKGKRPVPAPATPPSEVRVHTVPDDSPAKNLGMVKEMFDRISAVLSSLPGMEPS